MRYQIFSLQQDVLIKYGLGVEDALLLDWILNWKDGTGMKREFIEEVQDIGYWVNYETVVNELPILFKQSTSDMDDKALAKLLRNNKDKVGRMLKGNLSKILKSHKMVYRGKDAKLGSMIFVTIQREFIDELRNIGKEKAPTSPKADADNKTIDNNIIYDNKENIPSELMENNIDDVEAKNKALMERERTFTYDENWRGM